ncbi:hypothetical protein HME9302_02569 [Alteripontixanthobacter maritimus]|uniref:Resolvase/invertase-type recombinase catalytic domain-containing protein n=1 Tax=Alteripontixanthobacter maritimus TaxID=2161824 RepID=A0A369QDM6_9SPHN|nr:recombinase family protein [Alteripontixanthobacter maritimus]RDC61347.1 hypothetical protein HME9302_02569 [Alteripontixanthobacter maritimus]
MKKAVSYVRTPASMQDASLSMTAQNDLILNFAVANEYGVVSSYVDNGSGPNLPERARMLKKIGLTDIDYILVASRSRLSRDALDLERLRDQCAAWNVEIVCCS